VTRDEVLQVIADVQQHKSETGDVEVKTARGGTPKRSYEALSAFANHPGGGVMLFGLDEEKDFEVVGVGDAHRLQEDISSLAADSLEPALRPAFAVELIEGKTVVAVAIPEVPPEQKPCYYKTAGLQGGSYIRVGNSNRRMTDYEIFGYVSSRKQSKFDEEIVEGATMDDLDHSKMDSYVKRLRRLRPRAPYIDRQLEQVLKQRRIVREVDSVLRPTLAGLLVFGAYPQEYEPQLVITFLQFYGTTETEKTPRGKRFLDNRKFEGTIPEMVEEVVDYALASMRKSSLIEGLLRRDIPEYPIEAVREAVVNAVAHRDYSQYVRGSYVQIRLFADRLEVQSPGGLYGNVTEETLEDEQSTRNRVLMKLMEDLRLVENWGSGIRTMIEAMRAASLGPPRFQDRRISFWVTFHNHTLMSPTAVTWLNQFSSQPLHDRQRLALIYLRSNDQMTNRDYQRLNRVDSIAAYRELRGLVQTGLVESHGVGGGTYYTLSVPATVETIQLPQTDVEKIMAFVREHRSISNTECRTLLDVNAARALYLLTRLRQSGQLRAVGKHRATRYVLP